MINNSQPAGFISEKAIEANANRYKKILSLLSLSEKKFVASVAFHQITNAWQLSGKTLNEPEWQGSVNFFLPLIGFIAPGDYDSPNAFERQEEMMNFTSEAFCIDPNLALSMIRSFSQEKKDALNWLLIQLCNERQEQLDVRCHITKMMLMACEQSPIKMEYLESGDGKKFVAFDKSEYFSPFGF